jgi:MORN repeat
MEFSSITRRFGILAVVAILGFATSAIAQNQPSKPPGWIADSKTGCKVWNPSPQAHETIRWSGGCQNGYAQGKGTLEWFENGKSGDRYVGEYQAGKRNGHGVVTMSNGTRIEGDWRNDELLQLGVNEI